MQMKMKNKNENSEKKRICKKKAEFSLFIFHERSWLITCSSFETEKMIKKNKICFTIFVFWFWSKIISNSSFVDLIHHFQIEFISKRAVQQYMLCCTIDRNEASIIVIKKHDFYFHNFVFSFNYFQFVAIIVSIMAVVRSKMNAIHVILNWQIQILI